jgi:hypothetical protein
MNELKMPYLKIFSTALKWAQRIIIFFSNWLCIVALVRKLVFWHLLLIKNELQVK